MAEENGRICVVCGKVLTGEQALYCSTSCAMRAWRSKLRGEQPDVERTRVCQKCGREFEWRNAQEKYCSEECRASVHTEYVKKKYAEMRQTPEGREKLHEWHMRKRRKAQNGNIEPTIKKMCVMCGSEFETKHNSTKYCGDVCRRKAATIHALQWHARMQETPEGREKFRELTKVYNERQEAKRDGKKYSAIAEQKKANYELKKQNGWTRKCAYCKKWFAGEKGVKYCSDECREAAENEKEALMVGARTSDRICANCGKPLPAGRRQYCSDECRRNAAKLKRRKNKSKG